MNERSFQTRERFERQTQQPKIGTKNHASSKQQPRPQALFKQLDPKRREDRAELEDFKVEQQKTLDMDRVVASRVY